MPQHPCQESLTQPHPPTGTRWLITHLLLVNPDQRQSVSKPQVDPTDPKLVADSLLIEGPKILAVGHHSQLLNQHPDIPVVNGNGYLVFPGLVNGHTHCAMGFFRGLGHGVDQMIHRLFFPVESYLDESMIEGLSLGYILSGLLSGVTFFADHYYFVSGVGKALDRFGLRGALGETIADRGGAHPSYQSFLRAQEHLSRWPHSSRILPAAAPHATDTVSMELLAEVATWANHHHLPVHMHLAQTWTEWESAQKNKTTPVLMAHQAKLLGPRTLAVHLLHRTEDDLKVLQDTGTSVGVCPASQTIYERLTDLKSLEQHRIPLVIGTDCAASNDHCDVLDELRTFALFAKDRQCDAAFYSPPKLFSMATSKPYEVFAPHLRLGMMEPNYLADLVFVPIEASILPLHEPLTNIIYSSCSRGVKHVMVDGQWVLWNRRPQKVSDENITYDYIETLARIKNHLGLQWTSVRQS